MEPRSPEWLQQVDDALADVRRIRESLEQAQHSRPIRKVFRPIRFYALLMAPLVILYGVLSQWVYQSETLVWWGYSKSTVLWFLGVDCYVGLVLIKGYAYYHSTKKAGFGVWSFLWEVYSKYGYYRIVLAVLMPMITLTILLTQAGHAVLIPGVWAMGTGAMIILLPLALPLAEFSKAGFFGLFVGAASLFVGTAYPFYQIAVLFGGICLFLGLTPWKEYDAVAGEG